MQRQIRNFESYVHDGTFKDILASYLYSLNLVKDDEEILELTVGNPNKEGIRPIQYKTIQNKEVELIVHS